MGSQGPQSRGTAVGLAGCQTLLACLCGLQDSPFTVFREMGSIPSELPSRLPRDAISIKGTSARPQKAFNEPFNLNPEPQAPSRPYQPDIGRSVTHCQP